jgi:two-component system nitrate/nitrite response regulator NarL
MDNRLPSAGLGILCRVVVLSDVQLYREGLVGALAGYTDLAVVGAGPISHSGLDWVAAASPDIVLLEAAAARLPGVVRSILELAGAAKVIAYAIADEGNDAIRCIEAGAAGFVSREASVEDLVTTILRVVRGELPCSPRVAALLAGRLSYLAAERGPYAPPAPLTMRERRILQLIDEGLSNKEIACKLSIEVSTVKNHVHHILEKTRASRRAQAAARVRSAWITSARALRTGTNPPGSI